jgi:hypothetical protein
MSLKSMRVISGLALLMVCGLVLTIASCKKSPQQEQQTPPQTPAETQAAAPAAQPETKAAPQKPAELPAAQKPAAGMEPINITLPKPVFIGTPEKIANITNLEKPLGRPRDPFYAPKGTTNVALHKPVTGSDEQPIIGELSMITDGDKEAADGSYVELGPGKQYITIDLGAPCNIYAVIIWHYHKQARVYKDVVVQVAMTPTLLQMYGRFLTMTTITPSASGQALI